MWAAADQEAIEAAKNSVPFNERLMIEELNYQRPGEQVLLKESGEEAALVPRVAEQDGVGLRQNLSSLKKSLQSCAC